MPAHELIAWFGVHSPNFLSSKLSFERYVRGWRVVEKIRRAKLEGTFARVLAQWRVVALDLPKHQRAGGMFSATGPPAYFKRQLFRNLLMCDRCLSVVGSSRTSSANSDVNPPSPVSMCRTVFTSHGVSSMSGLKPDTVTGNSGNISARPRASV